VRLALFVTPVLIAIVVNGIQNHMRSGTIFQTGYEGQGWTTPILEGLSGLLLSPGKGLAFFSPLSILAVVGLVILWRTGWRSEATLIGSLFVTQLLFYSRWWAWAGGWTWGPRFLVSTQALLVLGLLPWLENRKGRILVAALATMGFLVQIIGVTTDTADYMTSNQFSYAEIIWKPEASQIVGQLGGLLQRRVYLVVLTQAYGLLSKNQTLAWIVISALLMILPALLIRGAIREPEAIRASARD
jgi:hypothetical protein